MPKGVYKHKTGWSHSEETKLKISNSHKGIKRPGIGGVKKGNIPWNKDKRGYKTVPCPESKKKRISMALKGRKQPETTGDKNPNWNGGVKVYRRIAKDNLPFICTRCSFSDERALVVHHKDRDRKNNSVENLEVLCCNCHSILHRK